VVTRAPFLTTRFGGYLHREVPEEDTELSHVGPDTPCGEYLRRFWQPICFSDELKDLPHRVKSRHSFRVSGRINWQIRRQVGGGSRAIPAAKPLGRRGRW
jgi:hypothetical protein